MYLPPPELQKELNSLHAEFRFTSIASGLKKDGQGGFEPDDDKPGCICCEIKDITTGEYYAKGTGADHDAAIRNAITVAHASAKPLTPAQKADGTITAQAARIKELEAQLAGRSNEPEQAAPVTRGRGRRKAETVPPDDESST